MPAQSMDAWVEGAIGAACGLRREGRGDERCLQKAFGLEQASERTSGGELRAIQQGEPFLGPEGLERFEARIGKGLDGRPAPLRRDNIANPDQGAGHMGERSKIAGGADRALFRNNGQDIACEHGLQQRHGIQPYAGSPSCQADKLQRHHHPRARRVQRLADASRMREHDIALQSFQLLSWDADRCELSEPGIDAIDRRTARDDARDRLGRALDIAMAGRVQPHRLTGPDTPPVCKCHFTGLEDHHTHRPLQMRSCNRFRPIL